MAEGFVMGATLQLKDMASSTFSQVRKATDLFKASTLAADRATGMYTDSQGKFRNALGQTTSAMKQSTSAQDMHASSAEQLTGGLMSLKGAIAAVAGAAVVKKGFDWLVGANADMETYRNTLSVVMGSQEKANKTLEWATKFAATTPFEIPQIVEATTRMQSYGLSAQDTLGIIGDMSSVMGKDLMQGVEAVADAQTGEVERLKEFGITKKMVQDQATAMGKNPINNQGQITDQKAFNAALFALMEKRYKGGMELQSKTFKGMLSNVQDFIGSAGRTLGAPIFNMFESKLSGLLDYFNKVQSSGVIDGIAKDINDALVAIGYGWTNMQTIAKPVLDWLTITGLPLFKQLVKDTGTAIVDVGTFVNDHWNAIGPIVWSIVGAMTAWKLGTEAIGLATVAIAWIKGAYAGFELAIWGVKNATNAWEAAQWLLDVAMDANPIATTILLLAALGLAIYEVVKHWQEICTWVENAWNWLKKWNGEPMNDKTARVTTESYTKDLTGVGNNASGTRNWRGGLTWVGEEGPELLNLPGGSEIFSNSESMGMANAAQQNVNPVSVTTTAVNPAGSTSNVKTEKKINIDKLIDKLELYDVGTKDPKKLVDELLTALYEKLKGVDDILSDADLGVVL